MKTGILGGTFNPVHNGHIFLATYLVENGYLDRVIFMVTGTSPHKMFVDVRAEDRLNMVNIAIKDEKSISSSDYEIKKGGKSYSYLTLSAMKEKYEDDEIFFILGADMFTDLPFWFETDKLRREFSFILIDRKNVLSSDTFKEIYRKQVEEFDMKVTVAEIKTPDISSTDIREKVREGEDISDMCCGGVVSYIKEHGLYTDEAPLEKVIPLLKETLSEKRFVHCKNVAETAKKLAEKWGGDQNRAYYAGFVHDIAKEIPLEKMNEYTIDLDLDSFIRSSSSLLHGPAGACMMRKFFNIKEDIFNACFYHTTGRENMSVTEKTVFLADYIEPGRRFPGIEEIRRLAFKDIDTAVVKAIDSTLSFLIRNNRKIYYKTVNARNFYING